MYCKLIKIISFLLMRWLRVLPAMTFAINDTQDWSPSIVSMFNSRRPNSTNKRLYTRASLLQTVAYHLFGAKPLSERMIAYSWFDLWEWNSTIRQTLYKQMNFKMSARWPSCFWFNVLNVKQCSNLSRNMYSGFFHISNNAACRGRSSWKRLWSLGLDSLSEKRSYKLEGRHNIKMLSNQYRDSHYDVLRKSRDYVYGSTKYFIKNEVISE